MKLIDFDTPYKDTISRQAAIDAMREETCMSCWDAKDILAHLPSVSTEKTGQWTIKSYQVPIKQYQVPSVSYTALPTEPTACKIVYTYTHSACKSEEYLSKYNYCPNCGCFMNDVKEMTEIKAESMQNIYEYIKENFEPVEDKPGQVWFNKRNFQTIGIETLAKLLKESERGIRDE